MSEERKQERQDVHIEEYIKSHSASQAKAELYDLVHCISELSKSMVDLIKNSPEVSVMTGLRLQIKLGDSACPGGFIDMDICAGEENKLKKLEEEKKLESKLTEGGENEYYCIHSIYDREEQGFKVLSRFSAKNDFDAMKKVNANYGYGAYPDNSEASLEQLVADFDSSNGDGCDMVYCVQRASDGHVVYGSNQHTAVSLETW